MEGGTDAEEWSDTGDKVGGLLSPRRHRLPRPLPPSSAMEISVGKSGTLVASLGL